MTSSEINFVNTCGICEEIMEESNIYSHSCVDGFEKVYIDDNRYFYPVCSNGKIIRRSLINNEEKIVLGETVNKKAEIHNNICDSTDVEELLIEEVSKREVLYNYIIPIQERSRNIINEMWAEVSKALNGRLDAKQAAKKWKMLRDSYSRELAKEKLPSGSGQPTSKRKWKHFNRMDFLRDTICTKKTSDNLIDDAENIPPKKKRSLTTNCNSPDNTTAPTSALDKIADAIATISAVPEPVQLPMLPLPDKQDEIDGLMLIISNQLRKLPEKFIEDGVRVENFTPFMYVDLSDLSNLAVYVQSLPSTYNVTEYKVWLINNGTKSVSTAIISTNKNSGLIRYNFSAPDGVYYVKVAALHPKCDNHGCANSTSPYICIKHASDRLLIMIISLIWIPPVLLYVLYHAFKLYRKKVLKRIAIRPNCLLVYSPTHPAHVNVMAELTKYLKCCNINVMIDMFDIPETTSKDPGLWCNIAFQAANVVLIVTSPPMSSVKSDTTIIYRNVDNHLLRLLKENYPQRNKRYYAVYLPYCKSDDIPEEARLFKKFRLPENLTNLVKTIHGISCLRFLTASDTKLLESIRCATIKIFENEASSTPMKNIDETDGLLSSIIKNEKVQDIKIDRSNEVHKLDTPNGDVIPQSFTTNIDELNLLGEVSEEKNLDFNFTKNDCEFHIDKLNL